MPSLSMPIAHSYPSWSCGTFGRVLPGRPRSADRCRQQRRSSWQARPPAPCLDPSWAIIAGPFMHSSSRISPPASTPTDSYGIQTSAPENIEDRLSMLGGRNLLTLFDTDMVPHPPFGGRHKYSCAASRWTGSVLPADYRPAARFRAMVMAVSSIMSSWPPTMPRRPSSTRMSRAGTPYLAEARLANSRKEP